MGFTSFNEKDSKDMVWTDAEGQLLLETGISFKSKKS